MGALFTYLMTYGGAVVAIFNPFYGLLIYICFAIIKPPAVWPWSVPPGNYSKIIAIAFLVGWALNGFGDRALGKAKPIVVCLFGYWLWVILSTLNSPNSDLGMPFVEYLGKIVLPFLAGVTLVTDQKRLTMLIWTIVGSCGFLAYEANLAYLNGLDFSTNKFAALDNNSFSILMVTGYGMALVLGFVESKGWRRLLCFGMAAAMAHVPMMSMSRGGMVGLIVATAVVVFLVPKNIRSIRILVMAGVVGVILAGPSVVREFSTILLEEKERDYSAQSRVDLWKDCIDATVSNPVFGVGQEHWGLVAPRYGWNEGKEAHSLWFQTSAELGVPGVTFLFLFYAFTILMSYRLLRDKSLGSTQRNYAMAIVASVFGFATSAAFVTVEGFELPFYVVLAGVINLKLAYLASRNATVDPLRSVASPRRTADVAST